MIRLPGPTGGFSYGGLDGLFPGGSPLLIQQPSPFPATPQQTGSLKKPETQPRAKTTTERSGMGDGSSATAGATAPEWRVLQAAATAICT